MNQYDVKAFDAVGDGRANDTTSIQTAIDHCSTAGGGSVYVPPGTYRCGTLLLKTGVELYLETGAVILGSPNRSDYSTKDNAWYDVEHERRTTSAAHLILAVGQERVSIRGKGAIDGNGQAFFGSPNENHPLRRFEMKGWRPGHMVSICDCDDVVIDGIRLLNSTTYTVWLFNSTRVRIQGAIIENPPETPNGDGIDIDSSRQVIVKDCFINTADDSVAIYSQTPPNAEKSDYQCSDVIVQSCVLKTRCVGLRLGPHGDAPVKNCLFSDLTIQAKRGVCLHVFQIACWKKGTLLGVDHGPPIRDIMFSDISMETEDAPVYMEICDDAHPPGGIEDISFSNVRSRSGACLGLHGKAEHPIRRLRFNNCSFLFQDSPRPASKNQPPPAIPKLGGPSLKDFPHLFYLENIEDARFFNVEMSVKGGSPLPCLLKDVSALGVDGSDTRDMVLLDAQLKTSDTLKQLTRI